MDIEAIDYLYSIAQSEGFKKGREDFLKIIHSDDDALNYLYEKVQAEGYKKDRDHFENLIGKTSNNPPSDIVKPSQEVIKDFYDKYFKDKRTFIPPMNGYKKGETEIEAAEFLKKMIDSPLFEERYNAMRGKKASPEEIEAYKKSMLDNIDRVEYWTPGFDQKGRPWDEENEGSAGFYIKSFDPEKDQYGIPILPENPRKNSHIYHKIYRKDDSPTVTLHELSHSSTIGDSIPATVRIPYSKKPEKAEGVKEFTGPDYQRSTEHKAYLDEVRKYLYDKKIYDPTKKEFDEKDYEKLINEYEKLKQEIKDNPKNEELRYLKGAFEKNILPYDKEDTIKLFNSYVDNNVKNDGNFVSNDFLNPFSV